MLYSKKFDGFIRKGDVSVSSLKNIILNSWDIWNIDN